MLRGMVGTAHYFVYDDEIIIFNASFYDIKTVRFN